MPVLVALFDHEATARTAEAAIAGRFGGGGGCLTQHYVRAPLDANQLPEGATEFGRNIAVAMVAGGAFMAVLGALAGAFDLMLGMGVGMGIALGFVVGLLMGLVGAMQAGTRSTKPAVRKMESRLVDGGAIVVVEIDARRADEVEALLEAGGAQAVEVL